VHVQDVVDANFCVLGSDAANYEAFNVGSGRRTSVLEYAERMIEQAGGGAKLLSGQYRLGDNRHSVSSVEKLRKLGWAPRRNLSQIHEDFLKWLDDIGGIPSNVADAYNSMCASGVVRSSQGPAAVQASS
jgi:dTDP-L-rhamnose 4-epimerase